MLTFSAAVLAYPTIVQYVQTLLMIAVGFRILDVGCSLVSADCCTEEKQTFA